MTLGLIGAAAGGTLVATQAAGGGDDAPSTTSTTPPGTTSTAPGGSTPATPAPGPTSAAFAGTMDGSLTGTSTWNFEGEPGISCAITMRNHGTTTLRLQTTSGGAHSGTLEMNGQQVVSAANCGVAAGLIPNAPFVYSAPVEGSGNTIRFTHEFRDSQTIPDSGSYSVVSSISFNATISGGMVNGSLTYNSSADFRGDGFSGRATWTGTIPVTMR